MEVSELCECKLADSLASVVCRCGNIKGNDYMKSNKTFHHQYEFVVSANSMFLQNLFPFN